MALEHCLDACLEGLTVAVVPPRQGERGVKEGLGATGCSS